MKNYPFYHSYIRNSFAEENTYGARYCQPWAWAYYNSQYPDLDMKMPEGNRLENWPSFSEEKLKLPQPYWDGHESIIDCYWKVWELAFDKKLCKATTQNSFVSDYNDTAFNDATFMWDSAFIALFGLYGRRVWHFQGTLDNFYCKQHPDGFICREIRKIDGEDKYQRFDPSGTGPNVLPWAEWEYYCQTGDKNRLAKVFPPLAAYTRWFRNNRTWPNGSYWGTGWSTGMDNQPRIPKQRHEWLEHCHQTWVDTCMQAVLADKILVKMARELGRETDVTEFTEEALSLSNWINQNLWDDRTGFYHDLRRNGSRIIEVKSIGAYWALLAELVPEERINRFLSHLEDPNSFKRVHCVPSLSADTEGYDPDGGYWRGAVWAPTNYMLLRGLNLLNKDALSHEIGKNHVENIASAYVKTGTLWENYAPDFLGEGRSQKDFVGWTGVPPVSVLFENVFGIKPDVPANRLIWDVRLIEEHGVLQYPFGKNQTLSLRCFARNNVTDEPKLEISGDISMEIEIRWSGNKRIYLPNDINKCQP